MTTEPTPSADQAETAHALLWRHGLPEDVIDGALCLHAQELAAAIRAETESLKTHGVLEPDKYRPCRDAANQIDPSAPDDTDLSEADIDRMMATGVPVQIVTAPPATYSAAAPPAGRAALRDRIAQAIADAMKPRYGGPQHNTPGGLPLTATAEEVRLHRAKPLAEAVLAVLPPPVSRADVLREAEEAFRANAKHYAGEFNDSDVLHEDGPAATVATWKRGAELLGRMADEEQPAQADRIVAYRSPGTRTLYCVICARQETGWEPVAAAEVQDGTVCDFCGGRVLAVASRTLGEVVARYTAADEAQPGTEAQQDGAQR